MTAILASFAATFIAGAILGGALTWRFLRSDSKALSNAEIQSLRVQAMARRYYH